jgi:biotin carboxyl carrier protein
MTDSIRVRSAPGTALPGDLPIDVDPATPSVEAWGPGRAVVHGERDAWALIGQDRPATAGRPRTIEVVVDGWRFELEVEPARRAELRSRAGRDRSGTAGLGPVEVRAMIPGRVVSVAVAPGDAVAAGQTILVIEAMKMQNEVRSPQAGTVQQLTVGPGDTIELGQVLAIVAAGS